MFDRDSLYKVLDAHFVNHLVRPDEAALAGPGELADAPALAGDSAGENALMNVSGTASIEGAAGAAGTAGSADGGDFPDNMLDDVLDELDEALEEIHDEFDGSTEAVTAAAIGFIDGVLAQSNGSYTTYEDAYVSDMRNEAYAALDDAVTAFAEDFDGNRDWGEAAKGYMRHATQTDGEVTVDLDKVAWQAQAQGFVYGADLCEDYEWKVIQAPSGGIVVTDEEAIEEFSMRQLQKQGQGGLFERVFNALGIDLDELKEAFEGVDEDILELEAEDVQDVDDEDA